MLTPYLRDGSVIDHTGLSPARWVAGRPVVVSSLVFLRLSQRVEDVQTTGSPSHKTAAPRERRFTLVAHCPPLGQPPLVMSALITTAAALRQYISVHL